MVTLCRSDLSETMRRVIRDKESDLGKKCHKIWSMRNRLGQDMLMGRFVGNEEETIVTLGAWSHLIRKWVPEGVATN